MNVKHCWLFKYRSTSYLLLYTNITVQIFKLCWLEHLDEMAEEKQEIVALVL